ncbi:hypothetical protein M9Y10_006612 [Tritrichomonas musculus]|uniref:HMA domain-containing protein n=1 Tax=Tritrichomonas musculus TaxID=1915356 RepID=A0ABR2JFN0_9EUKA
MDQINQLSQTISTKSYQNCSVNEKLNFPLDIDKQSPYQKTIKISGLDCPNCAKELEEEIMEIEGVESANVDFIGQKVTVKCDQTTLEKVINCCNNFEEVEVIEESSSQANETIKIKGLCCANCARELEEELNKIGDLKARVDFMKMAVILNAKTKSARNQAIHTITHFEDVTIVTDSKENDRKSVIQSHQKDIICIAVSLVFFIPSFLLSALGKQSNNVVTFALCCVSYLSVGHKVLISTARNILNGRIFDENFLMALASLCAILLGIFSGSGFAEGVAVMLLYQIGELLQSIAVGSSRNSISALMSLHSHVATRLENGAHHVVPSDELKTGDTIVIKAGEKVPVDCRIVEGNSSLDMKSLNGEPLPKEVKEGDELLNGCINLSHVIKAVVVREYKNSAVAKILQLVENSTARKSKPEKFITKFAEFYTPTVCLAAFVVALFVPTMICASKSSFEWTTFCEWIYKALNFLVISCPCALVISVPLTYFGGIGRCAKSGILVKGSTCLDELALCTTAAFDKTGTLTEGSFKVISCSDDAALSLAAAAEKYSTHPISDAFGSVETGIEVDEAEELAGKGVKCNYEGKTLLCGNEKLLNEYKITFPEKKSSSTLVYVALGGEYKGVIEIDDKIKKDVEKTVIEMKKDGILHTVMVTGDSHERAIAIADKAGIDECFADLLPDEKIEKAIDLKSKGKLLYVGDGINDAPVMTVADCAVSMGKVGSDAAIEASDIVLVSDNISLLPKGRKIAKCTRRIVMQNIAGSLLVKFTIMILSICVPGFPLIISVGSDVGVMLVAVLNAMRTELIK